MSKTISLPSGATATLRDPQTFKQKDRRKLYASMDGTSTVENGVNMFDNLIALLVEEWTLDLVPPTIKIDSLGELSIADYDALQAEAKDAMTVLFPQLQEQSDDPKAPTDN